VRAYYLIKEQLDYMELMAFQEKWAGILKRIQGVGDMRSGSISVLFELYVNTWTFDVADLPRLYLNTCRVSWSSGLRRHFQNYNRISKNLLQRRAWILSPQDSEDIYHLRHDMSVSPF